ncbi:sigma 54-interacting transcriptional regulator [Pedobacter sp. Leaf194]|uniref:sigma-54 dependent transcriptional regulator n=1 Tax=Pedobacter sp. Leaf194 TaxID=1736297 RepID=UPI000703B62D|nr:sigma 54-interacting transcriptional regulator [Pedobacter sp. Leaf194]KQS41787.1 hypothetical protein ASG14_04890 [Pedobacter sp. Leaf194]
MNEKLLIVEDEFIVANDLSSIMENAGYVVCATADTVEAAKAAIEHDKPDWVLLDIFLQDNSMGTELAPFLQERGIGFIYISANTNQAVLEVAKATQPYGFIVKPFREKDLLIMLDIARDKHESNRQFASQREMLFMQGLKSLMEAEIAYKDKLTRIPNVFQSLIPFDYLAYCFEPYGTKKQSSGSFFRTGFNEYQLFPIPEPKQPCDFLDQYDYRENTPESADASVIFGGEMSEFIKDLTIQDKGSIYGLNSFLYFVCRTDFGILKMEFFNKIENAYDHTHKSLLLKAQSAVCKLFSQISSVEDHNESKVLRRASRIEPLNADPKFKGIYGKSAALLHVLDSLEMVADTPVPVLILGESGTGKEMVARNLHLLSSRKDAPFVTVNCAAIPADLIESELFGHEKGAFTGALEKRIGKFEAAHNGTIFLDEVGELGLDSQVKLLRVLQEKQFERIGSSRTIKVDFRLVAATNRNLEKEVAEGRFRLDLFYRLNVYPITLPPLRDRKEDIELLSRHFLANSALKLNRIEIPDLSRSALRQLSEYHWPGNIRELEHLMERTLIRTRSTAIESVEIPAVASHTVNPTDVPAKHKTLEQIEGEYILSVLKKCKGKITGNGGAAEILGLPPSTLTSKMKKLGIRKDLYLDH